MRAKCASVQVQGVSKNTYFCLLLLLEDVNNWPRFGSAFGWGVRRFVPGLTPANCSLY